MAEWLVTGSYGYQDRQIALGMRKLVWDKCALDLKEVCTRTTGVDAALLVFLAHNV